MILNYFFYYGLWAVFGNNEMMLRTCLECDSKENFLTC